jgi:cobaltochelatase CobT
MSMRRPIAFLSYVRDDDDHDMGSITKLRQRLEGEVKVQSGKSFEIFQDRNDIRWGQFWEERIANSLAEVTFLLPIITPSFFVSPACRSEFDTFLRIEKTLGVNRLILPLYYVSCDAINQPGSDDPVVQAIKGRQWTDWRPFRFKPHDDPEVRSALADLAANIKQSIYELDLIAAAASAVQKPIVNVIVQDKIAQSSIGPTSEADVYPSTRRPLGKQAEKPLKPYYIYTDEFDEIIAARHLAGEAEERLALQDRLSRHVQELKQEYTELFEDFSISSGATSSIAVTLLLDNSGSLRGRPISLVAAWTVVLTELFERAGISLEILGYTTRAWKGGQSRQAWIADGKPSNPGRLNDLRHIIYKPFEERFEEVTASCSVMLREGVLKENVDGEALLWAYSRLIRCEATKRVLFVVSDGAPVDDATLSVNPGNFLEKHLISAARWLEAKQDIDLIAVGVGHEPRYYTDTYTAETGDFGVPIIGRIKSIIAGSKTS